MGQWYEGHRVKDGNHPWAKIRNEWARKRSKKILVSETWGPTKAENGQKKLSPGMRNTPMDHTPIFRECRRYGGYRSYRSFECLCSLFSMRIHHFQFAFLNCKIVTFTPPRGWTSPPPSWENKKRETFIRRIPSRSASQGVCQSESRGLCWAVSEGIRGAEELSGTTGAHPALSDAGSCHRQLGREKNEWKCGGAYKVFSMWTQCNMMLDGAKPQTGGTMWRKTSRFWNTSK